MLILKKIFEELRYVFLPNFCAYCDNPLTNNSILCKNCINQIKTPPPIKIKITEKYMMSIKSLSTYKNPMKKLVLAKTYSNKLAGKQIGILMWNLTDLKNIKFDYIIPTPIHKSKIAKRGFNQSEIIAKILSKKSKKPLLKIIKREKRTKLQAGLSKKERRLNLQNAFRFCKIIDPLIYKNKHFLIVDDLITTGATLKELGIMISKFQPSSITSITACRNLQETL